jgi:hypothetical protein
LRLLRLAVESAYLAVALPEFNIVTVNKLLRLLCGVVVINAFERDRAIEMPV